MDIVAPLLTDPASPRLTTYTDAGRMELSGQTLANWQSKVAHLLLSLGIQPGDEVGIIAQPGWQPAVIAIGAWHVGAVLSDNPDAPVFFTDDLAQAEAAGSNEVFLLSTDPFGRGVGEAGGDVPFGINDFSPEVRVHPDQFHAPSVDGPELAVGVSLSEAFQSMDTAADDIAGTPALPARVVCGPWEDAAGLARTLFPLIRQGSVVMSTDTSTERLHVLAANENAVVVN